LPLTEEVVNENAPINDTVKVEDVRQEPYNMPAGFEWCTIDVNDPAQVRRSSDEYSVLSLI
jgi:hypothetical protein